MTEQAASMVVRGCVAVDRAVGERDRSTEVIQTPAATGGVAAPARWEVTILRYGLPLPQADLLEDLLVSIALGAFAGLAGATVLRTRLAALMRSS